MNTTIAVAVDKRVGRKVKLTMRTTFQADDSRERQTKNLKADVNDTCHREGRQGLGKRKKHGDHAAQKMPSEGG